MKNKFHLPRKLLSAVLSALLLIAAVPMAVSAEDGLVEGYYTYSVTNGEATITNFYRDATGVIMVPSTLGGYPVTTVGSLAFAFCSSITASSCQRA